MKNAGVLTEGKCDDSKQNRVMPRYLKFTEKRDGSKGKVLGPLKCGGAVVDLIPRRRGKDVHVLAETQAEDEESAKAALKPAAKEIKKALGDMYYSNERE